MSDIYISLCGIVFGLTISDLQLVTYGRDKKDTNKDEYKDEYKWITLLSESVGYIYAVLFFFFTLSPMSHLHSNSLTVRMFECDSSF